MKRYDVTFPVGDTHSTTKVEASSVAIDDGRLEFSDKGELVAGFGEYDWTYFKREQEPMEQRARRLYAVFASMTGTLTTWEQLTEEGQRAWVGVAAAWS